MAKREEVFLFQQKNGRQRLIVDMRFLRRPLYLRLMQFFLWRAA
jgi:hypothetical protein